MIELPIHHPEEIANPVPAFHSLLDCAPEDFRHDLRVTEWFFEAEDTEEPWAELVAEYESIVDRLSATIRKPDFMGGYEDPGYPDELEWAPHLAYWLFDDRAIFVICDQQGSETPIMLSMGVMPRSEFTPREGRLEY